MVEIDGEKLMVSSSNFDDGSMIVSVGTTDFNNYGDSDFMEIMINKDGEIDYFTLPTGKDDYQRMYKIKPSHYGIMKTQNETNESAGGDFIRIDGDGKYAESFGAEMSKEDEGHFYDGLEEKIQAKEMEIRDFKEYLDKVGYGRKELMELEALERELSELEKETFGAEVLSIVNPSGRSENDEPRKLYVSIGFRDGEIYRGYVELDSEYEMDEEGYEMKKAESFNERCEDPHDKGCRNRDYATRLFGPCHDCLEEMNVGQYDKRFERDGKDVWVAELLDYPYPMSDRQKYRIRKLGGRIDKSMSRSQASQYIKSLMRIDPLHAESTDCSACQGWGWNEDLNMVCEADGCIGGWIVPKKPTLLERGLELGAGMGMGMAGIAIVFGLLGGTVGFAAEEMKKRRD